MTAVSALDLCSNVDEIVATASFVFDHAEDSDKADEVALLLAALRDAKQALAEVFDRVQNHLVACRPMFADPKTGELKPVREMTVVGLGVVEFKKSTTRKEWRNDDLRDHVVDLCSENEWDTLKVLAECSRPSWRVEPLRAIGVDPSDWCIETPGEVKPVIPTRNLEDRGHSIGEVA